MLRQLVTRLLFVASVTTAFSFAFGINADDSAKKDDAKVEEGQPQAAPASLDINTITLEDYVASREKYKDRPQPACLGFREEHIKDAVRKYILSLPDKEWQKTELTRYQNICKVRDYIIRIMERNIYQSRNGVLLREGARASKSSSRSSRRRRSSSSKSSTKIIPTNEVGKYSKKRAFIQMANENIVILKQSSHGKPMRYKWEDLAFEQWIEFFKYYGKKRIGISSGQTSAKDAKKDAANDFLLLAILCDWYGRYESALKYAKTAVEFDPAMKEQANNLILK